MISLVKLRYAACVLLLATCILGSCTAFNPDHKAVQPPPITNSLPTSVRFVIKNQIQFKNVSDVEQRIKVLNQLVLFLVNEFGSPPSEIRVTLEFDRHSTEFDHTYILEDNTRVIRVSPFSFQKAGNPRLVHELFHALYQTKQEAESQRSISESWPTYAQLRFQYLGLSNLEIKRQLLKSLNRTEASIEDMDPSEDAWKKATIDEQRLFYIRYAWPLLGNPELDNYSDVRESLAVSQ